MAKGIHVTTDKVLTERTCKGLAEYQAAVGGYIERVPLNDGCSMWFNEEGKLIGLPFNSIATDLALLNGSLFPGDVIVGDAFIEGPDDGAGDGLDLPEDCITRRQLRKIASEAGGEWR